MTLLAGDGGEPLLVEPRVQGVGADVPRMTLAPELAEADVVLAPAQRAGSVSGGERRRLVEEEELREAAGLKQMLAAPASELEAAGDPALAGVPATDSAEGVVEAAAIAVYEAPGGVGNQLAERRDPVLARQRG